MAYSVIGIFVIKTSLVYYNRLDNEEAEEFKNFIQNIKPSDFEKLMQGKHEETDQ